MPDLANTFQVVVADQVRAKKADAVYNRTPLLAFWLSTNQRVEDNMGEWFHVPVQVAPGPSGTWMSNWTVLTGQRVDNVRTMRFQLATIAVALDFPRREIIHALNVRNGMGNLISNQVQPALQQMRDDIATALFTGVTGYGVLESLESAVNQNNTYGQQSRVTYPALNATVYAGPTTLSISVIKQWINDIGRLGAAPNLQVTTPTLYAAYDNLFENKRTLYTATTTVETDYGKIGFSGLLINGTTTVLQDPKCQNQRVYTLYTPVFSLAFGAGGDFAVTGFLEAYDQLVWRTKIVTDLMFYCVNPRFNSRAEQVTP